ncbi:MAG: hypothetical protein K2X87_00500 [Gemmataceae bacterium]|nr:hypothetical protein [Gemmataceae bacterium]
MSDDPIAPDTAPDPPADPADRSDESDPDWLRVTGPPDPNLPEAPELSHEEFLARVHLLNWAEAQVGTNGIDPAVGDYVIAVEGRILGYGADYYDLYRRVVTEAGLEGSRLVAFWVPLRDL